MFAYARNDHPSFFEWISCQKWKRIYLLCTRVSVVLQSSIGQNKPMLLPLKRQQIQLLGSNMTTIKTIQWQYLTRYPEIKHHYQFIFRVKLLWSSHDNTTAETLTSPLSSSLDIQPFLKFRRSGCEAKSIQCHKCWASSECVTETLQTWNFEGTRLSVYVKSKSQRILLRKKEPENVNGYRKEHQILKQQDKEHYETYRRVGIPNIITSLCKKLAATTQPPPPQVYSIVVHEVNRYNAAGLFCHKGHKSVSDEEKLAFLKMHTENQ